MSELAKALAASQAAFPDIGRNKTVTVQKKAGGSYTFAYAPLDAILHLVRPVLTSNQLALSQLLAQVDGKPALRTVLMHSSGELLEDVCPLPMNGSLSPQEFGSLITYVRRYAVVSILGIATEEDDDGDAAEGNRATTRTAGSPPADDLEALAKQANKPSELPVHFGKNRGVVLGSLTPAQVRWYATEWQLQDSPSDYDHLLKSAAVALHAGDDSPIEADPLADVPFA